MSDGPQVSSLFFETGWATRPFFDVDYWLVDAPCDSAQKPVGPLEKF